jgi:hypothetical protein
VTQPVFANRAEAVAFARETGVWARIPCAHPGDTIRLLTTELVRSGCLRFSFWIAPSRDVVSFRVQG